MFGFLNEDAVAAADGGGGSVGGGGSGGLETSITKMLTRYSSALKKTL